MNLALLAPLGLLALAAVLVPLLLHLARRTPQRRTDFAALRWLSARLRPRRRIRIEEPWLLVLRMLLVASLALLFAQPVWTVREGGRPWVLVHPDLPAEAASSLLADDADAEGHWLAPGFPALDAPAPRTDATVSSLLREADAQLPGGTRLAVLVPRTLDGVDAERPRLARSVRWIVAPDARRPGPAAAGTTALTRIALRGPGDAVGRRFVLAAARANGWRVDAAPGLAAPPAPSTPVFWLEPQPPTRAWLDWVRQGGTLWLPAGTAAPAGDARVLWRDDAGIEIARVMSLGRGRVMQWRDALRPDDLPVLLDPQFPRGLAEALAPAAAAPTRADAEALRPRSGALAYEPSPRPLDGGLVWLALALFALERWLATRRGRSTGA